MNNSDSFNRRRFLKTEISDILNTSGLTSTFAQTNYPGKKRPPEDGSQGQPIIRL